MDDPEEKVTEQSITPSPTTTGGSRLTGWPMAPPELVARLQGMGVARFFPGPGARAGSASPRQSKTHDAAEPAETADPPEGAGEP